MLTIQIEAAAVAFSSWAMVGSATLAMAPSSTDMVMASQIAATDQ
jgi:hypothetical protein